MVYFEKYWERYKNKNKWGRKREGIDWEIKRNRGVDKGGDKGGQTLYFLSVQFYWLKTTQIYLIAFERSEVQKLVLCD